MLLITALKSTKPLFEKEKDLTRRIVSMSAHMSLTGSEYENPAEKIKELSQARRDVLREIEVISKRIQVTNSTVEVSVTMPDGKVVRKTISEWITRRQKTIKQDQLFLAKLTNHMESFRNELVDKPDQTQVVNEVVHNISLAETQDEFNNLNMEALAIDSALEIANATTELLD